MSDAPFVFDVSEQDFETKVMVRSQEVPVLVDFWAPWCAPCRTLGPTLERLATAYNGRFELAKIDVDQAKQLAGMLQVQSVPTVFLFKDGRPIDAFTGALPEDEIAALLEKHGIVPGVDPIQFARDALVVGEIATAEETLREVLSEQPVHGEARIMLARIALGKAELEQAAAWISGIPEEAPEYVMGQRLKGVFAFAGDAGDVETLRAKAEGGDVEARYRLGASLALQGEIEAALQAFLAVVMVDRGFREDAGRLAMLSLFDLLGAEDALVGQYRRRLASSLF